jgi:ABC-2 type transport system ATP-binding protein
MLVTLLEPTGGRAVVAGHDVLEDPAAVRRRIGVALQEAALDPLMTGRELIQLQATLHGMPRAEGKRLSDALLDRVGLTQAADRRVGTYSGGMRRRLDLAAALVIRPPVIFLDEPTTGLDPRSRLAMWEVIERRRAEGTTVLLTTQYLDEADRLADTIAVIDHGTLIAEGTSEELKDRFGGERLEVTLLDAGRSDAALSALASLATERPSTENGTVRVPVSERRGTIARAVRLLDEADVEFDDITVRSPTLDDVFLSLTGRPPEPEDGDAEDEAEPQEAEVVR